jgi:type I restriction enzyme S subunit
MERIRGLKVPDIQFVVQTYIGNKVRQAELLREWAKRLQVKIKLNLRSEEINRAVATELSKFSKASTDDLYPRLDPKYYGNQALKVLKATKNNGMQIKNLIDSVCNGFEERNFVENGIDYITVSEVSSGRLTLSSAPKISEDTKIPSKAYVNEKHVLVVRTGSIGTAIKVDQRDSGSVISSHLIKLGFESESLATAVTLFLNSEAGKILQRKISYGAVQPQIGQDELLALWIPQFIIDKQEKLMILNFKFEDAIRAAIALTQASKYLIESLITGQIPETLLIEGQQALYEGDNSKDRAILNKITDKGYLTKDGKTLFDDLDKFYELLDEAKIVIDGGSSESDVEPI